MYGEAVKGQWDLTTLKRKINQKCRDTKLSLKELTMTRYVAETLFYTIKALITIRHLACAIVLR